MPFTKTTAKHARCRKKHSLIATLLYSSFLFFSIIVCPKVAKLFLLFWQIFGKIIKNRQIYRKIHFFRKKKIHFSKFDLKKSKKKSENFRESSKKSSNCIFAFSPKFPQALHRRKLQNPLCAHPQRNLIPKARKIPCRPQALLSSYSIGNPSSSPIRTQALPKLKKNKSEHPPRRPLLLYRFRYKHCVPGNLGFHLNEVAHDVAHFLAVAACELNLIPAVAGFA